MDGWMVEWMDGWVGGWVDGWMDGWVDGWMHLEADYQYNKTLSEAECNFYILHIYTEIKQKCL